MDSSDGVFLNLRPEELDKAEEWIRRLRADEAHGVQKMLRVLNDFCYCPSDRKIELAFMVAGSSLGPKSYRDVDLFALPRIPLEGDPYKNQRDFVRGLTCFIPESQKDSVGYGSREILKVDVGGRIMATIALLDRLDGFDKHREGTPDDFIEPRGDRRGAERLFIYNVERGNKFAVLSRQYRVIGK